MTDQKKTLPFHITIKHGDEIITDIDTDGILAAISTENEDKQGGTAVHLLTECNTVKLIGLIQGAKRATNQAFESIVKNGGGLGLLAALMANANKDE